MGKTDMNQKTSRIIIATVMVVAIGFSVFSIMMSLDPKNRQAVQKLTSEEQQRLDAEKAARHAASIEGQFETVLNDFLKDIDDRARAYKNKRKILSDLTQPENLRAVEYIEENYALSQAMIPEMHKDMNALLEQFDIAENKIKNLSLDEKIEEKNIILERWKKVKGKQGKLYTSFFAFEQELVDRYGRLLEISSSTRRIFC